MELIVKIKNRVATYQEQGDVLPICGNTDDVVRFEFDDEWDDHDKKTARFIWGGKYKDVEFTGDTCEVPVVTNTQVLLVGVYAGELPADGFMLSTTTASIKYKLSARCVSATPNPSSGQNYTNEARGYAEEAKAAAAEAANGGFKVVGTYDDGNVAGVDKYGASVLFGESHVWNDDDGGGVYVLLGSDNEYPKQNVQMYNVLLELASKSTFIKVCARDTEASIYGYHPDEFEEVITGLLRLHIFEEFEVTDEQMLFNKVFERMPELAHQSCFLQVSTPNDNFFMVFLSPCINSQIKFLKADGCACNLVFTGYSDRVEEE